MRFQVMKCSCRNAHRFARPQIAAFLTFIKRNVAGDRIHRNDCRIRMFRHCLAIAQVQKNHPVARLVDQNLCVELAVVVLDLLLDIELLHGIVLFAHNADQICSTHKIYATIKAWRYDISRTQFEVENAMTERKIAALRQTVLFGELNDKELLRLAKHAVKVRLKKGDMLFFAGEEAKGLFVIVSGKVRAFQHNAEGREHVMHVDTAGAVMAEVPVFDDGPYPASAIAEEATTALFIAKQEMCRFCMEHPAFMYKT